MFGLEDELKDEIDRHKKKIEELQKEIAELKKYDIRKRDQSYVMHYCPWCGRKIRCRSFVGSSYVEIMMGR